MCECTIKACSLGEIATAIDLFVATNGLCIVGDVLTITSYNRLVTRRKSQSHHVNVLRRKLGGTKTNSNATAFT